jgi:hypothetical protein
LGKEIKKNQAAEQARWSKIKDWTTFSNRVERYFLHEAEEAKEVGYFCTLYVSKNPDRKQIQLFTGQQPTGEKESVRNELGQKTSQKLISEGGGSLVLSQSTLGNVAIILYPLKSKNLSRSKDKIIWAMKPSPETVSFRTLDAVMKDFFIYMRVSSARLNESRMDRLRIAYLEFRSSQYEGEGSLGKIIFSKWFVPAAMLLAAFASIYAVFK